MEIAGCPLPEDRLYDLENDVWWQEDAATGTALLGVLGTLGAFAGRFVGLTFRPVEGPLERGRSIATAESVRFTGAIRLPVESTVVDRNPEVVRRPRLLNDAPYTEGWVARLRPVRAADAARFLESAATIAARLEEQIRLRRIRCWPRTPELELVEIGLECSAVLVKLNEELARRAPGDAILLVTDDPTSPIEMVRWSDQTGHSVLAHRTEGPLHQFLVAKEANPVPRRRGA